jgi:crossover junction endodeoxyribonuclease RusA
VTFTVPGTPIPKGRARFGGGHAYTPQRTKAYEAKIRMLALRARQEARLKPFKNDVGLYVQIWGLRRGDITNVVKSLEDAMNRIVYDDDKQISYLEVERFESAKPHVTVTVEER